MCNQHTNSVSSSFIIKYSVDCKPSAKAKGTVAEGYSKKKSYKKAVAWADRSSLFTLQSKKFSPGASATRANVVTYLYLALDKDVKTPKDAVADMTGWGVNIADIFLQNEPDPMNPKDNIGYATKRPMTEPFGLALNYWDGGSVSLSAMDGKYNVVTGKKADTNGWYRAELEIKSSKLPAPGVKFDGARIETTIVSDLSFVSPEDKADYYFELAHESYDAKKAVDIFFDEGVNVVRLPVTWTPFVDDKTFQIDEVWLDKVAEEVDYILQNNAYCILDLHNDYLQKSFVGDHWETRWMDAQYKDYVDRRFAAIWKQIATYFKNYPRKLMFETCNEPTMGWYDGVEIDYFEKQAVRVNELNDIFVKTVRGTGGKNDTRILNIVSSQGSSGYTLGQLNPPEDDYLIAQVHAYDQMESDEPGFDSKATTDRFFSDVDVFVERTGIPVIIGETGVTHLKSEETYLPEISYFFKQAKQRDVPALWWEDFYSENDDNLELILWLYNKEKDRWQRPKILQAIKDAVK